jgi:uncharacterized protein with HEPN domain
MYLQDMLVCCHRILNFTAGLDRDVFLGTEETYWATVKNIEIIGEAAKYVPGGIRDLLPSIDWPRIVGTRNALTHGYFGINNDILWDIVENKIPDLERELKTFLRAYARVRNRVQNGVVSDAIDATIALMARISETRACPATYRRVRWRHIHPSRGRHDHSRISPETFLATT